MMKKIRILSGRRGTGANTAAEKTDRLVSVVVEGDTAPMAEPEPVDRTADAEVAETLRMIASIREIGASDTPLAESSVEAIMDALEHEVRSRQGARRDWLGMLSGFLACTMTLGSGLLLMGGTGYLRATDAAAAPVLAAAVASLAALASVLVHRQPQLRRPT